MNKYSGVGPMKKEPLIILSALLLFFLIVGTCVYTVDAKAKKSNVIQKSEDITGDGVKDSVTLKKISKLRSKKIILITKLSNGKTHELSLEKGMDQDLSLVDVNHDGVKDVFVRNSYKEKVENHLFSYKDFIFKEFPIPSLPTIQGQFLNGYTAQIDIQETATDYAIKLKKRKQKYDSLGIYQNGKVNEPTELVIDPYGGFKAVKFNDGDFGLKGVQRISGIEKNDPIALVESYYSLMGGNWILRKVMVLEVNR